MRRNPKSGTSVRPSLAQGRVTTDKIMKIIESDGASVPSRRIHTDPHSDGMYPVSAMSHTPASFRTAIRPDVGEAEAYKEALRRGEVGLQRPMGVNVRGVDFITAVRSGPNGIEAVVCTDVKTSEVGRFPSPKKVLPGSWRAEVDAAVARMKLSVQATDFAGPPLHTFPVPVNPAELKRIEDAIKGASNKPRLRQIQVYYGPTGQVQITGW